MASVIASFPGFSDVPGFCGPFEDDGDLYCVLAHHWPSNLIELWTSTDSGATWSLLDSIAMDATWVETVRALQDTEGRKLWVIYPDPTTSGLVIQPYDLAAMSWGSASAVGPILVPTGEHANFVFARRSDGSFIVYSSELHTVGVLNYEAIAEYLYDGSWTLLRVIGFTDVTNAIQCALISGSGSDLIHGFAWDSDNASGVVDIRDYAVKSDNSSVGTSIATSFGGRISDAPMVGQSLSWDDGGTQRLLIPYWQLDDLHVIEGTDADSPSSLSDTNLGTMSAGFGAPLVSAAILHGVRYIFAVNQNIDTSRNLIYFQDDGSGWTGPITLLASHHPYNVSVAPVLGGLAIIWDDSSGADEIVGTMDQTKFMLFGSAAAAACRYRGWVT